VTKSQLVSVNLVVGNFKESDINVRMGSKGACGQPIRTRRSLRIVRTSSIGKGLTFVSVVLSRRSLIIRLFRRRSTNPRFRQIFPEYSEPEMRDPPNMGQKERGVADDPPRPQPSAGPSVTSTTTSTDTAPAPPVPGSTPLASSSGNTSNGVASATTTPSTVAPTTTAQPQFPRPGQRGRPWLLLAGMAVVVSAVFLKIAG
jgi:hypothetical protein